jgi:SAM-dependent methyltransferase
MAYTAAGSRTSAEFIAPLLCRTLPIKSILDVGCAVGTWLHAWQQSGIADVHGVDGGYVDRSQLQVPPDCFTSADLSQEIVLGRKFDLVQCLEVAEHIDADHAEILIDTIVRHAAGNILFSAAPPGQGGENHINEKPYEYWRELFRRRGYVAFDYIRPRIAGNRAVAFWYRYNMILYVAEECMVRLPKEIYQTRVEESIPIRDMSPLSFRIRKVILSHTPRVAQTEIARLKARLTSAG